MLIYILRNFLSRIIGFIGFSMIIPLGISYYYNENLHYEFLIPTLGAIAIGLISVWYRKEAKSLKFNESVLLVVLAWIAASAIGALPFYLSNFIPSYIDAFFETISGFTATGSTILSDIESLPHSLLFWRSQTHWLGGMGIIVLALAIFPTMPGKNFLFSSEAPVSPDESKLFPRITEVSRVYWKIYLLLTIVQVFLLLPAMNLFDAVTHSFASIAGGGFSTKNNSIAYFDSVYVEMVLSFFMIAGATSFILHYHALTGKLYYYWRSYSFKLFMGIIFGVTILITINLLTLGTEDMTLLHALRVSFFQVVSLITTTGFATEDFKYWPQFSQLILILIMFVGGMSASTSGAIKVSRIEVIIKDLKIKAKQILHPNSVMKTKINGVALAPGVTLKVQSFIVMYVAVFFLASVVITFIEKSPATAFSAVAATLGNVGPGIASVGPFDNFASLTDISKIILSGCMLLGRLEIWTVLLIFTTEFWSI